MGIGFAEVSKKSGPAHGTAARGLVPTVVCVNGSPWSCAVHSFHGNIIRSGLEVRMFHQQEEGARSQQDFSSSGWVLTSSTPAGVMGTEMLKESQQLLQTDREHLWIMWLWELQFLVETGHTSLDFMPSLVLMQASSHLNLMLLVWSLI